ncbi:zinc ribbon-containing protein [Methylomarinum sp. Ch1-1]|uniref:Zinc ribbon-containing protein n=1 Tax=Methylomarinum roseum TaxID=3067653 RepID=A0AAU7NUH8_9GAMM|nr:zinc ribbon-containing protein [Methylomarinum sp. Ch1-1]MDP4519306.1 zinc ribbon-containing protein [Methylomarinum sp. Ch1-1]
MNENKFIDVYNKLMEHLYEAMDGTLHTVAEAMEIAKEKVSEFGGHAQEFTQEELDRISHYVLRDIEHAATSSEPVKDDESLTEWLKFDIELIENFALEAFMDVADKTRIELAKLENQARQYHPYKSGEITGPGTLVCDACGKQIAFKSTSVIPKCPKCDGENFTRC